MPFTKVPCSVTDILERLGHGIHLRWEILRAVCWYADFFVRPPMTRNEIDHSHPGRILSRHDCGSGWGAYRSCGIGFGKPHPFCRKTGQVRSLIETVAINR